MNEENSTLEQRLDDAARVDEFNELLKCVENLTIAVGALQEEARSLRAEVSALKARFVHPTENS